MGRRKDNHSYVAEDVRNEIKLHKEVSNFAKGIDHIGIIKIYETFEDSVNLNLVLEWADQGDLFDYVINHFKNPESLSDRLVIQNWQIEVQEKFYIMCSATKFMHDRNIAHRDISLENILMISNKNNPNLPAILPRICDFGLATKYNRNSRMVDSVGKSGYWSPQCENANYDGKKNDVWCLGVALFLMLIGGPPYGQIYDKAFQTMYDTGPNGLNRLVHMYDRSHLMPVEALELLGSIFLDERFRSTINDVLAKPWMLEARERLPKI